MFLLNSLEFGVPSRSSFPVCKAGGAAAPIHCGSEGLGLEFGSCVLGRLCLPHNILNNKF